LFFRGKACAHEATVQLQMDACPTNFR
jgi:hypothetical protein